MTTTQSKTLHDVDRQAEAYAQVCVALVSMITEVPLDAMTGPTRGKAEIARGRQLAMYLAATVSDLPYAAVGRAFGRDRTTVQHAIDLVVDLRDDEPEVDAICTALEAAFMKLPKSREEAINLAADLWWL